MRVVGLTGLLVGACTLGARDKDSLSGGGGQGGKDAGADGSAGSSGACDKTHVDCDGVPANGCETLVSSDPKNCGKCANVCPSPNGNTPTCTAGVCGTSSCKAPSLDCDSDPATCETNPLSSATNCGFCGNACKFDNATAACVGGNCQLDECDPIHADCDGVQTNGCEAALNTLTDCGGCATACSISNAVADCNSGTCEIGTCNPGFENCDANAANGCEAILQTDPQNCGKCGTACSAGQTCKDGTCQATGCAPPTADCDSNPATCETNVQTSVQNCGFCNNGCNLPSATANCTSGVCGVASCNAGTANCDGNAGNGCETTLGTSSNCKACGDSCTGLPNVVVGTCAAGSCNIVCSGGFGNCNGNSGDGCETTLSGNAQNCGSCGKVCGAVPNAAAACSGSVCGFTCNAGFGDCNPLPGCETNLSSSPNHCGACGRSCGTNSCSNGFCAPEVISSSMGNARALDLDGQYVYVGRMPGGTHRILKTGGAPQAIDATASAISVDALGTQLFWLDPSQGVFRRNTSGSGSTSSIANKLGGYCLDAFTDGNVYFSHSAAVSRVSSFGGLVTDIDPTAGAHGVRQNEGSLYWALPALGQIRFAPLPGNGVAQFATGQAAPESIDGDTGYLYWTNNGDGTIRRMPLDQSTGPVDIATGQTGAFAIRVDNTGVYWTTDAASGGVYRAPLAGGPVVKLAENAVNARAIALDGGYVYWAEFGSGKVARVVK